MDKKSKFYLLINIPIIYYVILGVSLIPKTLQNNVIIKFSKKVFSKEKDSGNNIIEILILFYYYYIYINKILSYVFPM